MITSLVVLAIGFAFVHSGGPIYSCMEKKLHEHQNLTDQSVIDLAKLSDMNHFRTVLNEILIQRVVGTPNHEKVGNFIVNSLKELGWDITEDIFSSDTPVFGPLNFRNIIAKLNPNAERYLTFACHYESKLTIEDVFVGAIDSAVPCSMMINLAKVMSEKLNALKSASISLMFIFFDGEEAFKNWDNNDSLYGSRHLAQLWENTLYQDDLNNLHRIDILVLLDLLGTPDPTIYGYHISTKKWHKRLFLAERRLAALNQLEAYSKRVNETYFRTEPDAGRLVIDDDHRPFMEKNVAILHVIPYPFPSVWHNSGDDITALDFTTIDHFNKIFRVFVVEYLHLGS